MTAEPTDDSHRLADCLSRLIDEAFHLGESAKGKFPKHKARSNLRAISDRLASSAGVLDKLVDRYQKALREALDRAYRNRSDSDENGRWSLQVDGLGDRLKVKPEPNVERWLAKVGGSEFWSNQVPVFSGLLHSRSCIDLVRRIEVGTGRYELIELKLSLDAGNPVFAAFEVFRYAIGLIWWADRVQAGHAVGYDRTKQPLIRARSFALTVLAPPSYLKAAERHCFDHRSFERSFRAAVKKAEPRLVAFRFRDFPPELEQAFEIDGKTDFSMIRPKRSSLEKAIIALVSPELATRAHPHPSRR